MWMVLVLAGCIFGSKSPVRHEIVCADDQVDLWRLKGAKDGTYNVTVDTRSEQTTFDPIVELDRVVEWAKAPSDILIGDLLDSADDDFECSFPPPRFECPNLSEFVSNVEQDLLVIVGVFGDCVGSVGEYELVVERDGKPQRLSFVGTAQVETLRYFGD